MSRARILGIVVVLGVVASLGLVPVGSAAAAVPGDVVISELMFDPVSGLDGDEFLELTNTTAATVDLSGWSFSGITLVFAAGTTIGADGRMVVGPDAARSQLTYGVAVAAVYTGALSNGGEAMTLRDATAATIDSVTYADHRPVARPPLTAPVPPSS